MFLAIAIAIGILLLYQVFVIEPMAQDADERQAMTEAAQSADAPAGSFDDAPRADGDAPRPEAGPAPDAAPAAQGLSREEALMRSERVSVRTPALEGSIALTGARLDDLRLLRYDTEPESDTPVTLFNPAGAPGGYFAVNGWAGVGDAPAGLPGLDTQWRLVQGDVLTPQSPVVLEHRAGALVFTRTISVDENYLFTVDDRVENTGSTPVSLARYGLVRREGLPVDLENFFILHEGPIAVTGGQLVDRKYDKLLDDGPVEQRGEGGWAGITDKYWLAAVAPDGAPSIRAQFRTLNRGQTVYESNYIRDAETIPAGGTIESRAFVFAGSKNVQLLQDYQDAAGIPRLVMAVDWGMFWFLTRPFYAILHFFNGYVGNFALAIMALTVLIKLVLFPLNNRAFASMAKMRAVQPKMEEIRERFAADKERQQKELIDLYRREKINPIAGCLPILPQIPIFFALYKTVFLSLDARHERFLWVNDMSAPDPTSMWNLFGLLPYDPSGWPILGGVLAIGVLPLIMGVTMWAQMALNPPPPDPIQRRIFAFMPVIFTIVLAPFAAALVIYWAWNNTLTILQQYVIMRRHGTETGFDKFISKMRARLQNSSGGASGGES
jgi:YidC/Oxa1 family membrane protein insertase